MSKKDSKIEAPKNDDLLIKLKELNKQKIKIIIIMSITLIFQITSLIIMIVKILK